MSSTSLARCARVLSARARRAARDGRDAGASALEWAIIAAVVVVAASLIGGAIYKIVQDKSQDLQTCASVAVGSSCAS
ncbi:hypothetical protein [Kineococcus aurantiacus]|uniref:Uncharacterized protein n=1 Tax=Kineococcus aurantiacus TaxID=37633 RepID=A0A7Y9AT59_9ACTN|nr:hypothetical protein [Kineococcus aurantiacus]NYD20933.1 hypothetical protein [Kineococcus aurantiacus]